MEWPNGLEKGFFALWNVRASRFVVQTENFLCKLKADYSLQADQGRVSARRASSRR